jgi:hypothetical protein
MKDGLSIRFITFGADVPQSRIAGGGRCVHKAMEGIERDREQGAALPFERVALGLPLLPDFGGAPALHHQHDLLVEMPLGMQCTGAGDFHDVHPPQAFGAVELDVAAAAAEPRPRLHRQVLHALDADAAKARHALRLHEAVVRHGLAEEFAEARVLAGLRLVPMFLIGRIVHVRSSARI